MKPFARGLDTVWIDGQTEPIAISNEDDLSDGVFLAGVNRLSHFCEQMRCQLGPTWRVEQAQYELRHCIECTGIERETVVNNCGTARLIGTGSVIWQKRWRQSQGV